MKSRLKTLFSILLIPTLCFSQSTYRITSEQLKKANLIFVERDRLHEENKQLELMLDDCDSLNCFYNQIIFNYNEKDSIYINNEKMYIEKIEIQKKENKSLDNKNIILKVVIAVETVLLISLLLLK